MKPEYHYDIKQGSDEWLQLRAGRITGTDAATLLVNGKSASGLGSGAISLIYKKAAEFVTGPEENGFVNNAMQRGTELEPYARAEYEDATWNHVEQVGFVSVGEYFGVSPDGIVGDDGLIEIKCPMGAEFVRFVATKEIPEAHMAQMQWVLFLTGRKWCDYVVFNPDFAPAALHIVRVHPMGGYSGDFMEKISVWVQELERVLALLAVEKADA